MIQNLLNIESKSGGEHWLRAVDDELTRQEKIVDLREGKSPLRQFVAEPIEKITDFGRRLFGKTPENETTYGETSGPGGVPGGSSRIYLNPNVTPMPYTKSLEGRNPYVQSMVDTLRHELGGHVMNNLTPGAKWYQGPQNEETAQALTGEAEQNQRSKEVQQHYKIMPRYMAGEGY
jgi:hypothetical protein